MIDTVWRDIRWARPVVLPAGEDARSILQRNGARALDGFLERADRQAEVWTVFRLAGSLSEAEALLRGEEVFRAAA